MHHLRSTAAALALALAAVTPAAAADCVDYTAYLRASDITATPDDPTDIALAGDLAYVATSDHGLHILDISDPTAPQPVGDLPTAGVLQRIALNAPMVYALDATAHLIVIDAGDPTQPTLVGQFDLPEIGRALCLRGDLLLVACGEAGLALVDVANPPYPYLIRVLDTPGFALGVVADQTLAVVADGPGGLQVVDLGDPARPALVGSLATAGDAFDVAAAWPVIHAACDDAGLELAAVTGPTDPVRLAVLPLRGFARRVTLAGATTLVAARDLCAVDAGDPFGPVLVGRVAVHQPAAIAAAGAVAFLGDHGIGLVTVDIANPESVPALAATDVGDGVIGVATDGPYTYLAAGDLLVLDHTDPTDPAVVATVTIPGDASRVALHAGHAYVTAAGGGDFVHVVDIADPLQPVVVDAVAVPGFHGPVLAHAGALYIGDFFHGGLYVLDLADPARPLLQPTVPTAPYAIALAAAGDLLWVSTGAFGGATIAVHGLADPLAPALLGTYPTGHDAIYGLDADGDLLVAAFEGPVIGGVTTLDYTTPTAPVARGHVPVPGDLRDLVLVGGLAYTVSEEGFLHAIDLADPATPRRLGETVLPAAAFVLAPADDRLHVAATVGGLVVLPAHCDPALASPQQAPSAPLRLVTAPNPFNPSVTFHFTLPHDDAVSLDIVDLAGRRVACLLDAAMHSAGAQAITWRPRALPSGTYLARLRTSTATTTTKVTLVR